jgi:hypothetical protein
MSNYHFGYTTMSATNAYSSPTNTGPEVLACYPNPEGHYGEEFACPRRREYYIKRPPFSWRHPGRRTRFDKYGPGSDQEIIEKLKK